MALKLEVLKAVLLFTAASAWAGGWGVDQGFRMTETGCRKQSVSGWNMHWFGPCGDVTRMHVSDETRAAQDLTGLRFEKAKLKHVELGASRLDSSDGRLSVIQNSHFSAARFENADLRGAVIYHSDLQAADFAAADLRGTKFVHSEAKSARFAGAKLQGAEFLQTDLEGADFSGADLRDAVLVLSSLKQARFDCETRLPFRRETALRFGMVRVDGGAGPCR